jgi:hypothetical protein
MNKKGVSQVIVVILIILIAIASIAIFWLIISGFIERSVAEISLGLSTINIQIVDTPIRDTDRTLEFSVKRELGKGKLAKIKVILEDKQGATTSTQIIDAPLPELEQQKITLQSIDENQYKVKIFPIATYKEKEYVGGLGDEALITLFSDSSGNGGSPGGSGSGEITCTSDKDCHPDHNCIDGVCRPLVSPVEPSCGDGICQQEEEESCPQDCPENIKLITSCQDLQNINNDLTADYFLATNIDCQGFEFTPIGEFTTISENPKSRSDPKSPEEQGFLTQNFSGNFNGQGFEIKNLKIVSQKEFEFLGLFKNVYPQGEESFSTIKNVKLINIDYSGEENITVIGGLAGFVQKTQIDNVYVHGKINSIAGVGGIVGGLQSAIIQNSISNVEITGTSTEKYGREYQIGLLNVKGGKFTGSSLGGIAGAIYESTIENSYSTGNINSENGGNLGGIAGSANKGLIIQSHSDINIIGGGESIGGLVGKSRSSEIENSYATGDVTGKTMVGGLIGKSEKLEDEDTMTITNSYSTGKVTGETEVGGLIGEINLDADLTTSVTNSYWDIETSGISSSAGGEGKTTSQMKQQSTFVDWDFETVWQISEGTDYPKLRN